MDLAAILELRKRLHEEIGKVVIGQSTPIDLMFIALLSQGHVLLHGVPGVAKTLLARCFAACLGLEFGRIQFTPDLMPGDVVGTNIYDFQSNRFQLTQGPIFTQLLLADEINRTPPKTQAALLEAMQERKVTIDGTSHDLGEHFMVMATQNPIEQEGTYPLPEAQVDRFMLKIRVSYPSTAEERKVIDLAVDGVKPTLNPVASPEQILAMRDVVSMIYIDDKVRDYVLSLVQATRDPAAAGLKDLAPLIDYGASPRASIFLATGARALAFLEGRGYVTPQDVKDIAKDVLQHRVLFAVLRLLRRPAHS